MPSMSNAALVLVDDGRGAFGPLTDLASAAELRTGAWTTREWLTHRFGPPAALVVPHALAAVTREATGIDATLPTTGDVLLVNVRLADRRAEAALASLARGDALVAGDTVLAARLDAADARIPLVASQLPKGVRATPSTHHALERPWHVLDGLAASIAADIAALATTPGYCTLPDAPANPLVGRMGSHPVVVHETASIAPYVVFDASAGPIHVGPKATIRPFSVLSGPCSIGAGSTVADRSLIKANTTCGPQCRLGGEIGGTSIAGYSNKTHDGHLGDSILGSWVNLGAGTDNSNLLNTYGEVPIRLDPEGPRERTGRIFFGAVIGDHVKCAIGTRLMTGTVLGTGAMIASSAPPPSTTARFAWRTDDGERRYALPKFLEVMRTVMKRRTLEPGAAYVARVSKVWDEGVRSQE
ncbi:MAG: hypothetical protein JNM94_10690 [Phycisphaerae bacterium]|nr:hypothetical protein [Phycisphaerae bacterium]